MASSSWPPALKQFVNETFSKCTEQNRAAVEAELKGMIFRAFESNELWSIDWPNVKLESLNPPTKKRKSVSIPSALHPDNAEHVMHRIWMPPGAAAANGSSPTAAVDDLARREKRAKRFTNATNAAGSPTAPSLNDRLSSKVVQGFAATSTYGTPEPDAMYDPNVIDWDAYTIVGTSTKLEKPFLRLTSLPDPTTIRPLPILKQTLELLKQKWRKENNYGYICDQFKSMRQDLTVQRIKNDFTVSVYEIHARIALEKGDLGEFNQCQGQLRELYKHGLPGHKMEFLAYRILYLIFSKNRAELNATMAAITDEEKRDECVAHALAVRQATSQGNYVKLFRLFLVAPKMGAYLMDHFVARERVAALVTMTKAYQQLSMDMIVVQLAFDDEAEAEAFLAQFEAAHFLPAPAAPSTSAGSSSAATSNDPSNTDKKLNCKLAHPHLLAAMSKFSKVDIKGQV